MTLRVFTGDEEQVLPAPPAPVRQAARELIKSYLNQVAENRPRLLGDIKPRDFQAGQEILEATPSAQVAVLVEAALTLAKNGAASFERYYPLQPLLSALLRRNLPCDRSSTESLLQSANRHSEAWASLLNGILGVVQRHVDQCGMSDVIRKGLESLQGRYHSGADYVEERTIGKRIETILDTGNAKPTEYDLATGEAWTNALLDQLSQVESTRDDWQALLLHCSTAGSSQPSQKWLKQAGALLAPIGEQGFIDVVRPTLAAIGQSGASRKVNVGGCTHYAEPSQIHDTHSQLLRGLVWTASLLPDETVIGALGDAAEMCFQKIPNVGPRSPKIGNACLQSLSRMNHLTAVAQISRLKMRAKHASTRNQLVKALQRAAESVGMTEADLEEIAVPTFGFTEVGCCQRQFGDFAAELRLNSHGKTRLVWIKPDGKTQKTVPAAIKESRADDLKTIKSNIKEMEKLLPAQRNRLEQLLRRKRSWKLPDFRRRFLDHPLVGVFARPLVWRFQAAGVTADGIWHEGRFVDSQDQPLDWIDDQTTVAIWHPMLSDAEEVLGWREWLERREVCQPFKQAHREIYILTDAERETAVYSNRFAAHIIRQHQFSALCQQRAWRYSLQGAWDSHNTPYLELPEWDLRVEFWVEPIEDEPLRTEHMLYLYLTTDQVRFHRLEDEAPLRLANVPDRVFSEVMRDIDLFVGVCSVGNDPNWSDAGFEGQYRDYWREFAFGELSLSALTRKEVLQRVVPRLGIAERCSFDDKFLVVRGQLRTYKIHLGSGNVLMSPNNQYLCIVAKPGGKRTDSLFLPFEGDNTLAIILSKAFLLAEDDKIKDDSILMQISG